MTSLSVDVPCITENLALLISYNYISQGPDLIRTLILVVSCLKD